MKSLNASALCLAMICCVVLLLDASIATAEGPAVTVEMVARGVEARAKRISNCVISYRKDTDHVAAPIESLPPFLREKVESGKARMLDGREVVQGRIARLDGFRRYEEIYIDSDKPGHSHMGSSRGHVRVLTPDRTESLSLNALSPGLGVISEAQEAGHSDLERQLGLDVVSPASYTNLIKEAKSVEMLEGGKAKLVTNDGRIRHELIVNVERDHMVESHKIFLLMKSADIPVYEMDVTETQKTAVGAFPKRIKMVNRRFTPNGATENSQSTDLVIESFDVSPEVNNKDLYRIVWPSGAMVSDRTTGRAVTKKMP